MIAYQINAFIHKNQGGNPAGVVLGAENLSAEQMQTIAHNLGFSETAFVRSVPDEENNNIDFHVRFFTPNVEVDFCGHATLGCFSLMYQKSIIAPGQYKQLTKAGILSVDIAADGRITQQQTRPKFLGELPTEVVAESVNISPEALNTENFPIQCVTTGLVDVIIPIQPGLLDTIEPNFQKVSDLSERYGAIGYHLFELNNTGEYCRANCRNFAPLVDIPEESATGSASGALAAYLNNYHINQPTSFRFIQGKTLGMPSEITVNLEITNETVNNVYVSGYGQLIKEINL